ncbi:uroporphyrinogen-III synthase [Aquabacterium sp. A08]|uniref:uroporphyrinogen-III synthase n=1 Tax=Aquabacterium sp. A08 TaxID=2718532 RepID=UPI0014210659|nr:uroporphyrinogen-III synthase [Aquabacterium sp. A08]NIC43130.1 uroporphyrinogen-III synthase [Aquabacterium sp. A08]
MSLVVVTRPAREAATWVQALGAAGHEAHALPLIDIAGPPDAEALAHIRRQTNAFDALMFVSAQAVDRFWSAPGPAAAAVTARCWAPGPGTARALRLAGVPLGQIDQPPPDAAQFDSEALWARVAPQVRPGHRLLIVHGVSGDGHAGRDWLARQCAAAGGQVGRCVAYQRRAPVWTSANAAQARAWTAAGAWWLFSSSEALAHLAALLPGQDWAAARALATHPRIAQTARAQGWGRVLETRPALPDVLRTLESLH